MNKSGGMQLVLQYKYVNILLSKHFIANTPNIPESSWGRDANVQLAMLGKLSKHNVHEKKMPGPAFKPY